MKVNKDFAAKIYDLAHPGMTNHGMLSEDQQRKALEHIIKRMDLKEPPSLQKIYDFSVVERARQQLDAQGWKP